MIDRVVEVETYICAMPERRAFSQHGIARALPDPFVLRLKTQDGIEGWGEAMPLAQWGGIEGRYYGETASTVRHIVHDLFASILFQADVRSPRSVMAQLDAVVLGHPYAKAMVEMALQDIRGKRCGEPLFRLLGGAYRDRIRIGHSLGLMPIEEVLLEAQRSIAEDAITAFQIKGGTDPLRDVELVARLRKALPQDIFLRLDANKGFGRFPKTLADIARRLEAAGVDAIEQPASTVAGLAACRAATNIPIIADEACWTSRDVLDLWQAQAVDCVSVVVAKAAGMEHATNVTRTAALVGYGCDVNGSLETGIGNAASLHVALAAETLTLASIIPVPSTSERSLTRYAGRYWDDDLVHGAYTYEAGFLQIAEAPGLGIAVNQEKLARYSVGRRQLSQP